MIITLLGVYIVMLGFITLTLFQGHRCFKNIHILQIACFEFLSSVV